MNKDEYVTTMVIGNRIIPVGLNDAGQTYFFEYLDEDGNLKEECCGSYNTNYIGYIEYKFGDPEADCKHYSEMKNLTKHEDCPNRNTFGYCDKCFYQDVKWSSFKMLWELGIVDRRGNVTEAFKPYIIEKENGDKDDNR